MEFYSTKTAGSSDKGIVRRKMNPKKRKGHIAIDP